MAHPKFIVLNLQGTPSATGCRPHKTLAAARADKKDRFTSKGFSAIILEWRKGKVCHGYYPVK